MTALNSGRVERRHPTARFSSDPITNCGANRTVKDAFADEEVMEGSDEPHAAGREVNFRSRGGWSEARGDSWALL